MKRANKSIAGGVISRILKSILGVKNQISEIVKQIGEVDKKIDTKTTEIENEITVLNNGISNKLNNDYANVSGIGKGIIFDKCADGNTFTFRPILSGNILQLTKNDAVGLVDFDTSGNVSINNGFFAGGAATFGSSITATGMINAGSSGVRLWQDSEGGNIEIYSPASIGGNWQIDSYNGDLRFFHFNASGSIDDSITIQTLKKSVSDGKSSIASAITSKGVATAADATFETMASNIGNIKTTSTIALSTGNAIGNYSGYTGSSFSLSGLSTSNYYILSLSSISAYATSGGTYNDITLTNANYSFLVSRQYDTTATDSGNAGKLYYGSLVQILLKPTSSSVTVSMKFNPNSATYKDLVKWTTYYTLIAIS